MGTQLRFIIEYVDGASTLRTVTRGAHGNRWDELLLLLHSRLRRWLRRGPLRDGAHARKSGDRQFASERTVRHQLASISKFWARDFRCVISFQGERKTPACFI